MGKGFTYKDSKYGTEINIFKDVQIRTKDGKKEFQKIIKNKQGEEINTISIPNEMIQKALANGYTAMAKKLRSINFTGKSETRLEDFLTAMDHTKKSRKYDADIEDAIARTERKITDARLDSPIGKERKQWGKSNVVLKGLALAGGGYIYLSERNRQDPDECKKKCITGENTDKTAKLAPPSPGGANCPTPGDKTTCKQYCTDACSSENCLARSQHWVRENVGAATTEGVGGLFKNATIIFW